MGIKLSQLVAMVPSQTEDRVKLVKDSFNRVSRTILRRETGLRLGIGEDVAKASGQASVSVPIYIKPGIPDGLEDIEFPDDQRLSLLLAPWRKHLEEFVESGCEILEKLLPDLGLADLGLEVLKERGAHFPPAIKLAEDLLEIASKIDLIEMLFDKTKPKEQTYIIDVLGCYWYNGRRTSMDETREHVECRIDLYWGVIGLCAQHLNTSVEGLALKVLAHELGHAYSHVGADIDGNRWLSADFIKSDPYVKEGIAQYYALKVLEDLQTKFPEGLRAFQLLLPKQPKPYHAHKNWEEYKPEEIRQALLAFRRNHAQRLDEFEALLKSAKRLLRA